MSDIVATTLNDKFNKLKETLKAMDRVIIAYSGGVDSAFLLKAASMSGLEEILAVTGISESLPEEERSFAAELASSLNVKHRKILTEELKNENYVNNPPDRCYYCKKDLFSRLRHIADNERFSFILDGTNADDAADWRPGRRAAVEEGVVSPLLDAGLTKKEIREISRRLGLSTWDKPATPCLSSRFPYGNRITPEALARVHRAESFLRKFGIRELRVREHSGTARIEVHPEDFRIFVNETVRGEIVSFLKAIGYKNITLDLQGFRSGSANEGLNVGGQGESPSLEKRG
jgi:uncharacterized protein